MKSDARKLKDIMTIAEERGLFRGARTKVMRGRMPEALVSKAKARTGIKSDTELLELALANLAVADDYLVVSVIKTVTYRASCGRV